MWNCDSERERDQKRQEGPVTRNRVKSANCVRARPVASKFCGANFNCVLEVTNVASIQLCNDILNKCQTSFGLLKMFRNVKSYCIK